MARPDSPGDPTDPGATQNQLSGSLRGQFVQTGAIYGGLHTYPPPPERGKRRRRWWAVATAGVLVVAGGTTAAIVWSGSPDHPSPAASSDIQIQGGYSSECGWHHADTDPPPKGLTAQVLQGLPKLASSAEIEITAQTPSNEDVLLLGMGVQVKQRSPAPRATGSLVSTGECGGGETVRLFNLNLDTSPAKITALPTTDLNGDQLPPVSFPYKVNQTDPEIFLLSITDRTCDCEFSITVDWVENGKHGRSVIDDKTGTGREFHVVPNVRLPGYHILWPDGVPPTTDTCAPDACPQ